MFCQSAKASRGSKLGFCPLASDACQEFVSGSTEHSQTVFAQHEAGKCAVIKPPLFPSLWVLGMSDQAMDSFQTLTCLRRVMWMERGSKRSSHSWRYTYTRIDLAVWNVIVRSCSEQKDWWGCVGLTLTPFAPILQVYVLSENFTRCLIQALLLV